MYTPSGLKNKMVNQARRHQHQGQNRPHQKTLTYPHGPLEPAEPHHEFFGGSESLERPPLPCLNGKNVPVVETLLYDQRYQNQSAAKDKQI